MKGALAKEAGGRIFQNTLDKALFLAVGRHRECVVEACGELARLMRFYFKYIYFSFIKGTFEHSFSNSLIIHKENSKEINV